MTLNYTIIKAGLLRGVQGRQFPFPGSMCITTALGEAAPTGGARTLCPLHMPHHGADLNQSSRPAMRR